MERPAGCRSRMRKQTECGAQCSKFFAVDNHPFLVFNENYDQKSGLFQSAGSFENTLMV
jgi:hypothetical protein